MKRIFVLFSLFFLTIGLVILADTIINNQPSSIVLPEIDQAVIDQAQARNVSIDVLTKEHTARSSGILLNSHLVLVARHSVEAVLEDDWKKGDNFISVIKDSMIIQAKSVAFYQPTEFPDSLDFMKKLDLALIELKKPGFPLAPQYNDSLLVNYWVKPETYLFLYNYRVPQVSDGVQFKKVFDIKVVELFGAICYLVDAIIEPGVSGTGLYTLEGRLAGVAIGYHTETHLWIYNISYGIVIPIHYLIYFTKPENLKVVIL